MVQYIEIDSSTAVAYRVVGAGQPLVMITGWPFHSATYEKLLPYLMPNFQCILLDSPGLGLSRWGDQTDFTFAGQAKTFRIFLDKLGLETYFLLAHNTGATIARLLVVNDLERVQKFIMLNTEIPHERPPWFPLYARLMHLPFSNRFFRLMLRSNRFLTSPMGFGGCFQDSSHLNGDFIARYIQPLIDDHKRLEGASRYLRIGLDFNLIDSLAAVHQKIICPVHLIWGNADPTFPIAPAYDMLLDFPNAAGLTEIEGGRLLFHEEFPQATAQAAVDFLQS